MGFSSATRAASTAMSPCAGAALGQIRHVAHADIEYVYVHVVSGIGLHPDAGGVWVGAGRIDPMHHSDVLHLVIAISGSLVGPLGDMSSNALRPLRSVTADGAHATTCLDGHAGCTDLRPTLGSFATTEHEHAWVHRSRPCLGSSCALLLALLHFAFRVRCCFARRVIPRLPCVWQNCGSAGHWSFVACYCVIFHAWPQFPPPCPARPEHNFNTGEWGLIAQRWTIVCGACSCSNRQVYCFCPWVVGTSATHA